MAHVQAMVDRVSDHFGRIDILVNNAGTGNAYSFEAMDDDLLSEDLQLKLYGAVHCTRAVLPALKERGGVIINITTPAGKAAPGASVPTSLARAAGIALTKALANEYAGAGIRVNTVCVNNIRSRQNDRRWQSQHADDPSYTLEQFYQDGGKRIPLGRIAPAEEAGDVIVFWPPPAPPSSPAPPSTSTAAPPPRCSAKRYAALIGGGCAAAPKKCGGGVDHFGRG